MSATGSREISMASTSTARRRPWSATTRSSVSGRAHERRRQWRVCLGRARRKGSRQQLSIGRDGIFLSPVARTCSAEIDFAISASPFITCTNERRRATEQCHRQYRRLRRDVLASLDDRQERIRRRPRPGISVQLRERLSHRGQHGPGPAAGSQTAGRDRACTGRRRASTGRLRARARS